MTTTTRSATTAQPAAGRHRAQHRAARRRAARRTVIDWQLCARAAWTVLAVVGTLVGTCAVVAAAATRLSPIGQFTAFGHPVLIVTSGSMAPVIRAGDLVVEDPVTPAQAGRLRAGQVASFRAGPGRSAIITSRIIAVSSRGGSVRYYTRADASSAGATARPASEVIGAASYSISGGGSVLTALRRPLVLGLLIGSPLLWLLAAPLCQFAARITAGRASRRRRSPGAWWSRRACGRPTADGS